MFNRGTKRRIAYASPGAVLALGLALRGLVALAMPPPLPPRPAESEREEGEGRSTHSWRPILPSDPVFTRSRPHGIRLFIADTVVNNTDPTLKDTDTFGDSEPSIAIDPLRPERIAITAFSGEWGDPEQNAPLWYSSDGGELWTKSFSIAPPPSGHTGPNDQTIDYDPLGNLFGTFLSFPQEAPHLVFSGSSARRARPPEIGFFLVGGAAQVTNINALQPYETDQPWIVTNHDPRHPDVENTYVAYVDIKAGEQGLPNERVAVARGTTPPQFVTDLAAGQGGGGGADSGLRPLVDRRSGAVYVAFESGVAAGHPGLVDSTFWLNRSTDGGRSWGLNGQPLGIPVAAHLTQQANSTGYKFGTVNALIGGIHHAAVDRRNGTVYYAVGYHDDDGNNRLNLVRVKPNSQGGMDIAAETTITSQLQVDAALPAVAVAENGVVGILYQTFEGTTTDGYPLFTAHLAVSADKGASFSDLPLLTSATAAKDDPTDSRQRLLGDYQQMKAVRNTFFGTFTGDGAAFGRPFANTDAIFFKANVARLRPARG
jgi:hypothetical protein